ncbi:MAG: 4Fe-4S dicluster domain-containing protein [Bacillota bacterium]
MPEPSLKIGGQVVIEKEDFGKLFDLLAGMGYRIVGPTVRNGAIVYDELTSVDELPVAWTDEQEKSTYRLKQQKEKAYFDYGPGPQSWKRYLHPPAARLWRAEREDGGFKTEVGSEEIPKYAFIGVRPCDLHAMSIQDKVLTGGKHEDTAYSLRRKKAFIVAVNCRKAGGTCFCASMGTGPRATIGFDLALTEVIDGERHYFVVEAGTDKGAEVLRGIPYREAGELEKKAARETVEKAAGEMGRELDTTGIKDMLYRNLEHPRWDKVSERCLTCGNCTMVCPTCFCTTVEDYTDLKGKHAERRRKWDSCFTTDFSYIHGGSVRSSAKSRYRQWLTHKLGSWIDQFGSSGCVGCGRCITFCPAGIDITEEVKAIRDETTAEVKVENSARPENTDDRPRL